MRNQRKELTGRSIPCHLPCSFRGRETQGSGRMLGLAKEGATGCCLKNKKEPWMGETDLGRALESTASSLFVAVL